MGDGESLGDKSIILSALNLRSKVRLAIRGVTITSDALDDLHAENSMIAPPWD